MYIPADDKKNKSGNEKTPNTVKQENVKRAAELSRKAEVSGEVKVGTPFFNARTRELQFVLLYWSLRLR